MPRRVHPRSPTDNRVNAHTVTMEPKTYQFLVGIFASLGSALFGYDLGVIAGVIGSTDYIERFQPGGPQK